MESDKIKIVPFSSSSLYSVFLFNIIIDFLLCMLMLVVILLFELNSPEHLPLLWIHIFHVFIWILFIGYKLRLFPGISNTITGHIELLALFILQLAADVLVLCLRIAWISACNNLNNGISEKTMNSHWLLGAGTAICGHYIGEILIVCLGCLLILSDVCYLFTMLNLERMKGLFSSN